jgi:acyl-CoA reductase-like NAD-dependent aldehyde dehydrogenase
MKGLIRMWEGAVEKRAHMDVDEIIYPLMQGLIDYGSRKPEGTNQTDLKPTIDSRERIERSCLGILLSLVLAFTTRPQITLQVMAIFKLGPALAAGNTIVSKI